MPNIPVETIAETENYTIWAAEEPDGERTYHVELGPVTAHFFTEEWQEFLGLIRGFIAGVVESVEDEDDEDDDDDGDDDGDDDDGDDGATEVELDWGTLYFTPEEWGEFMRLIEQV
jgi:hypothetical protein